MNDHGVKDGEHGTTIAEEPMVSGAGRLDRRRLVVGAVAGTASLLLPREAMAALRLIHVRVHNNGWGDKLFLEFFRTGESDSPTETWNLNQGHEKEFTSLRTFSDGVWNTCSLNIGSLIASMSFGNPSIGLPWVIAGGNRYKLDKNQSVTLRRGQDHNLDMTIKRQPDSDDYIEFTVQLDHVGRSGPRGDKQDKNNKNDKQDKKDSKDNRNKNDNNARRRRGSSGSKGRTDRRERPVDRLLG